MARGYVIITETVNDPERLNAYAQKAVPTIMQGGGKVIVFEPNPEVIEGEWTGQTVILEFESVDAAKAWYNSDAYQAVIGERQAAADSNAIIVSGFDMPGA